MQASMVEDNGEEDSQVCRSCQQQFWGLSASSLNSAEHLDAAKSFTALMPTKLFPALLHETPVETGVKMRSSEWMQDQLKDCLLEE